MDQEIRPNSFAGQDAVIHGGHLLSLCRQALARYCGRAAIRLWNGEYLAGDEHSTTTILVRQPAVLPYLAAGSNLVSLGEAFLSGKIDVDGPIEAVFDLVDFIDKHGLQRGKRWQPLRFVLNLPAIGRSGALRFWHTIRPMHHNNRASIAYHYDLSNDFYRLWLDPEMIYSCAYFHDEAQSLAAAQQDKLDYICRKLRLRSGKRLLDIGCGWGALICHAAAQYGVQAHGITLSQEQHRYACQRIQQEGLANRVSVSLCDYRELPETISYDAIASVGMFEHIGITHFPAYFGKIRRLLAPGGLFLNHGISNDTGLLETPVSRFVNHYVFPDGELTRISEVAAAMESAGFEIIDVENLRQHYLLTCRHWVRRLEQAAAQVLEQVDERTFRLWRLYLAGAAYYFQEGSLRLYQALATSANRAALPTPLRRDDLCL